MTTEDRLLNIEKRNKKVELDKAWELSWTRRIIIFILTYIVIVVFFIYMNISRPFTNALVPSLAFVLSTMTLPLFKRIWIKYIK